MSEIEDLDSVVLPTLRTGIFHVTGPVGYIGIRAKRAILPGVGKALYPNANDSFSRINGYVSLFDFTCVSDEQLDGCDQWKSYFPPLGSPFAIGLKIKRDGLGELYVPNSEGFLAPNLSMPYFECWSSGPIPWECICGGFVHVPNRGLYDLAFSGDDFPELEAAIKGASPS